MLKNQKSNPLDKWMIKNGSLESPETLTIYSNNSNFLINVENYSEFMLTNAKVLQDKEKEFKSIFNGGSISWNVCDI